LIGSSAELHRSAGLSKTWSYLPTGQAEMEVIAACGQTPAIISPDARQQN
jgi:hypothetical protein